MQQLLILLLIGWVPVIDWSFVEAQVHLHVLDRTARAVAQVRARNCGEEFTERAGSGFLFGHGDQLITALHVVAGCNLVDAYFERAGGRTTRGRIERVLESADLALLRLDKSIGEPLVATNVQPRPNDELEVIAHFLGAPTLDNKTLKVTFGLTRLRNMLPEQIRISLTRDTAIDINLDIVRLDGHLLPGASGAPLINAEGEVVAIGAGGLRHGAASISWAVPSGHLDDLLNSFEQLPTGPAASSELFAESYTDSMPEPLRCGSLEFVATGTRTFAEISAWTDDPLGLHQMLDSAALPFPVLQGFSYRIYSPLERGAAIAIPVWMEVESREHFCVASSPRRDVTIEFGGAQVGGPRMAHNAALQFELQFHQRWPRSWAPDMNFSYLLPQQRIDGLTVYRKASFTNDRLGPPAWAFETLMLKGDTFAAVIGILQYQYGDLHRLQMCRLQRYTPSCEGLRDQMVDFAQTTLGVHLSTFSVY